MATDGAALSLPCSDVSAYRLEKISEIEAQLRKELEAHEAVYKKYTKAVNVIDCAGNTLSAVTVTSAVSGVTLLSTIATIPAGIALESIAAVSGSVMMVGRVMSRRLNKKAKNTITYGSLLRLFSVVFHRSPAEPL